MEKKEFDSLVWVYFVVLGLALIVSVAGFPYSLAGVGVLLVGVVGAVILSVLNPHEDVGA